MRFVIALALATLLVGVAVSAQDTGARPAEKFHVWLYWHTGLMSDANVAKTLDMIQRMKKAGYTGLALLDNKLHRLSEQTPQYVENVRKVRKACTDAGLDLIAVCLPLGYANDVMVANPNLAAAMPVVDAPFAVKEGKIVPDDPTRLVNGDFSDSKDNKPAGWGVDSAGKGLYVDTEVKYNGKPSIRMEDIEKNGEFSHMRAFQTIKVKPFRYYHMSVAVKTENYKGGDTRLMALGSTGAHQGRVLNLPEFAEIKSTQDWVVYHKTFNTLDFTEVGIYIGSWDGRTGKVWFADVKFEPAGLSDMVRRPGAPFKATSADGKTTYSEGKDLPEMKDPGLGMSPYKGGYQWHDGPQPKLPDGSRLKEGDKLLLSYYHTAVMCYNDQVPICQSEPETYEVIDRIVQSIAKNMQPDYWYFEHDEIRMMGWCKACTDSGKTCGQILGENISRCYAMVKKAQPGVKGVYVWSDMFDPYHNAGDGEYALVRGKTGWSKSWERLPREMGLINWNSGKPESPKFFSEQGHPQIFSGGPGVVNALKRSAGLKGVTGAIYVTWSGDFGGNVEKFADEVLKWKKEQK
jgi:hypothetical protein